MFFKAHHLKQLSLSDNKSKTKFPCNSLSSDHVTRMQYMIGVVLAAPLKERLSVCLSATFIV